MAGSQATPVPGSPYWEVQCRECDEFILIDADQVGLVDTCALCQLGLWE